MCRLSHNCIGREFSALRLGLIQMAVGVNKVENVSKACQLIRKAAKKGAKLIALPVGCKMLCCFNIFCWFCAVFQANWNKRNRRPNAGSIRLDIALCLLLSAFLAKYCF